MNDEKVLFISQAIELSEQKDYLEMTNRLCYYDDKNLNNVILPSEGAEEKAQTLVNMPVVGAYTTNNIGEPTFKGHECAIDPESGELIFLTDNLGTHTEVYIENDNVDVSGVLKNLPCLFARCRIWTRNKNVVAAVKRLFNLGKLYTSWELSVLAYEFKEGIKILTDYSFLGNCILGWDTGASPAYGKDAKAIQVSARESQLMIAEAFTLDKIENQLLIAESLSKDLIENQNDNSDININTSQKEEENILDKNKENKSVSEEAINTTEVQIHVDADTSVATNTEPANKETATLTEYDLRNKIEKACEDKIGHWCYVAWWLPLENTVWVRDWQSAQSELDYLLFTYQVSGEDVTVSDPTKVTLTVSLSQVNSTIEKLNTDLATRDTTILDLNSKIQTLSTEISTLVPYKEKFEQAEQEKIEQETANKKETLKNNALQSKYITQEEVETSEEIKTMIDSLDVNGINRIIAERVIAATTTQKSTKKVETAQAQTQPIVKTNIVDNSDVEIAEQKITHSDFIRAFIG